VGRDPSAVENIRRLLFQLSSTLQPRRCKALNHIFPVMKLAINVMFDMNNRRVHPLTTYVTGIARRVRIKIKTRVVRDICPQRIQCRGNDVERAAKSRLKERNRLRTVFTLDE